MLMTKREINVSSIYIRREAGAGALRTRLLLCMPAGMSEAEEACLWRVSQRSGAWRPSRGARAAD